jgi:hypothetical protein
MLYIVTKLRESAMSIRLLRLIPYDKGKLSQPDLIADENLMRRLSARFQTCKRIDKPPFKTLHRVSVDHTVIWAQ